MRMEPTKRYRTCPLFETTSYSKTQNTVNRGMSHRIVSTAFTREFKQSGEVRFMITTTPPNWVRPTPSAATCSFRGPRTIATNANS